LPATSTCQISTFAFDTGVQFELELTTLIVSVNGIPGRSSRMSLRNTLVIDGNGPAVSVGVTAHAALLDAGSAVGAAADGEGVEPLQPNAAAAPAAPINVSASRRPIFAAVMVLSP